MTSESKRVIVVTGGTSGIGLECCKALARPNSSSNSSGEATTPVHVIVVGRDAQKLALSLAEMEQLAQHDGGSGASFESFVADLSSLEQVRQLANFLISRQHKIFSLVCNAGVESPPNKTTNEGHFETTFATNHLSHFLLGVCLQQANLFDIGTADAHSNECRLVIVSSGLHDAETGARAQPDVSDWQRVAFGSDDWTPNQAYCTSKLCNLLFGYEFMRRFPKGPRVLMYSPGFVPTTGLFRNHPMAFIGLPILRCILWIKSFWQEVHVSTSERSGGFLARLALETQHEDWQSGSYFHIDQLAQTSKQSRDPELGAALWERSMTWIDTVKSASTAK